MEQYSALLTKITEQLAAVQKQSGAKLLWVKTTPVPTVPMYGPGCNDTRTWCAAAAILSAASLSPWAPSGCRLAVLCDADRARCANSLNPPRFDADVVLYNAVSCGPSPGCPVLAKQPADAGGRQDHGRGEQAGR